MISITETGTGYIVSFKYEPWIVRAVKKIPGWKFNPVAKHWEFPPTSKDALLNWAKQFKGVTIVNEGIQIGEIDPLPELDIDIPLLQPMFHYQEQGVAYGAMKRRLIVGDEPGLGKTVQAIAMTIAFKSKCTLVICPATLKNNWKAEWKKWTGRDAMILSDRVKKTWPQFYKVGMCNVFIANFESLKKLFVVSIDTPEGEPLLLKHINFNAEYIDYFDTVIIDESHRCKDGVTQTAKFVMGVTRGKENIVALTGTPVVNKPKDLIPQLHIINQLAALGGYKYFVDRYCKGPNRASNLKELNFFLYKTCFYRRQKKDVLKDLPDKMRTVYRCEITNRKEYQKAENEFVAFLQENLNKSDGEINTALRGEVMVKMGILKKLSAIGKLEEVIEQINEVIEAGEKLIVFAWHKDIVMELKRHFPRAVTIVGDDSMDERNSAVYNFQKCGKCGVKLDEHRNKDHEHVPSDVPLIICNIKSGGVGITLTASSRVWSIEQGWNPATGDQCEDRAHRIGQKNSVDCRYFLGHKTIDEDIYKLIEKKREMVGQVMGGDDSVQVSIIDEFINLFSKKMRNETTADAS